MKFGGDTKGVKDRNAPGSNSGKYWTELIPKDNSLRRDLSYLCDKSTKILFSKEIGSLWHFQYSYTNHSARKMTKVRPSFPRVHFCNLNHFRMLNLKFSSSFFIDTIITVWNEFLDSIKYRDELIFRWHVLRVMNSLLTCSDWDQFSGWNELCNKLILWLH